MKIKEILSNAVNSFVKGVKRFPLATLLSLYATLMIISEINSWEIIKFEGYILLTIAVGIIANIFFVLCKENGVLKVNNIVVIIATIIIFAGTLFLNKRYIENSYFLLAEFGGIAILVCLIALLLYRICDKEKIFAHLAHHLIFTSILTSVLFGGLALCFVAINSLVYEFKHFGEIIGSLAAFVYIAIEFNLMLAYIPNKDEKLEITKEYSVIVNKVALVIYLILIAVLYVYLGKIVITGIWPANRVNYFVSAAVFLFCVFYLSTQAEESGLNKVYLKISGLLLIPLMIMQGIAIYIRVNAYGLTIFRYLSIVLNIIGLFFVVDSIFVKKITWVFAAMAIVIALATIGPLNIIDVPINSQVKILETALKENGMLSGDNIIPKSNISEETKAKIISAHEYLSDHTGMIDDRFRKYVVESFEATYGFSNNTYHSNYKYYMYSDDRDVYDIGGYKSFKAINSYNYKNDKFMIEGIDCTSVLKALFSKYGGSDATIEGEFIIGNHKIYIKRLSFEYNIDNKQIDDIYSMDGYILEK